MSEQPTPAPEASQAPNQAIPASPTDVRKLMATCKANLAQHLAKKKQLDRDLVHIESTLYQFETSYLAPPPDHMSGPSFGNIIKGYDSYLKAPNATLGLSERKRVRGTHAFAAEIRPEDRLFSTSSETYLRALELKERDHASAGASEDDEDKQGENKRKRRHG